MPAAAAPKSSQPQASEIKSAYGSMDEQLVASTNYLEHHKIPAILHRLVELLVYHRPEDPRAFMAKELRDLKAARVAKSGTNPSFSLFSHADLASLFKIYDSNLTGSMNQKQYTEAMTFLGIKNIPTLHHASISMEEESAMQATITP
ncbi:hypothetical protein BC828DRAFT_151210 [Blastocladiella britannica]|nr:hypothetical protein BC828DRAFT_151210 [Blastocladiella britannica]